MSEQPLMFPPLVYIHMLSEAHDHLVDLVARLEKRVKKLEAAHPKGERG